MAVKKMSWRRSNQALSLLFLSFFPLNAYSMSYFYQTYQNWKYPYPAQKHGDPGSASWYTNLNASSPNNVVKTYDPYVPEMTQEQKATYVAEGRSWQEMMEVFHDSPQGVQDIVDHLGDYTDPTWRSSVLVGPPGTGKTTAALAVPHLAHWYWKFISAPELASKYRNETKEKLADEINNVLASGRKTVFIIDEFNKLLESHNKKGHDSDMTGGYVWTILDKHKLNHNIFVLSTMNRDDGIADPLKQRFGGDTFYFPEIEPEKFCDIFRRVMARNSKIALQEDCTDEFLASSFITIKSEVAITPRDFENIRHHAARLARRDAPDSPVRKVTPAHITDATSAVAKAYARSGFGREQLTDEELRDFTFVQNRIIDVKLQCAQKIQATIGFPVATISRPPGLDMNEVIEILEQEFTPQQIALYKRVTKKDCLIEKNFIDRVKQSMKEKAMSWLEYAAVHGAKLIS